MWLPREVGVGWFHLCHQELKFNGSVGTENDAVDLYELGG